MSDLNDLAYLLTLAEKASHASHHGHFSGIGQFYCSTCNDYRKMNVTKFSGSYGYAASSSDDEKSKATFTCIYTCRQCETSLTALVYIGPNGQELIVLPSVYGGLSTQNTPVSIKYYLDQASRSQSIGANSAAIVMFRSALEHLLYEQGYTKGMLAQKITALENGTEVVPPPKWAVDINAEYLKVMKELGNGAVHTNNGDISLQSAFDGELVGKVKFIFHWLLDTVYEKPIRDAQNLAGLQKIASSFPKK